MMATMMMILKSEPKHDERDSFIMMLLMMKSSVPFKMVSMRSGKPIIMRSTLSLRSFPNVAFETVPMFVDDVKYDSDTW